MKYALISDDKLVLDYQNGNPEALNVLLRRNQARVYGFVLNKVQDPDLAKDLLQDTFIKVIQNLRKRNYVLKGKFVSWVLRISHNLIIDYYRKEKRIPKHQNAHGLDIFDFLVDCSLSHESKLINQQVFLDLKQKLKLLPEEQKQVIELRIFMGLSFKDIAEQTGVSINTALGRMRYAILNLRKSLELNDLYLISA